MKLKNHLEKNQTYYMQISHGWKSAEAWEADIMTTLEQQAK